MQCLTLAGVRSGKWHALFRSLGGRALGTIGSASSAEPCQICTGSLMFWRQVTISRPRGIYQVIASVSRKQHYNIPGHSLMASASLGIWGGKDFKVRWLNKCLPVSSRCQLRLAVLTLVTERGHYSPHTFQKRPAPKKETPIVDLVCKATSAALITLEHLINSRGMTRCL